MPSAVRMVKPDALRQNRALSPARIRMSNRALRADLLMLLTAMIWGSVFVAQSIGMRDIGPFLFSAARFLLASLVLLPLCLWRPGRVLPARSRGLWRSGLLLGLVLSVGINLQQVGLLFTAVTNAGFITGLYVILVPLLGLLLGQRSGAGIWVGASLALLGLYLLSIGETFSIALGDSLQLAGALAWAVHVLLVAHLARHHDPLQLALLQFFVCGLLSLLLAVCFEPIAWPALLAAAPSVLYGALVGVAIGFTLQLVAQRDAIAAHAAVIFSLEAVFAALAGAWLLDEQLTLRGYLGCALMLAGMLAAQLWPARTAQPAAGGNSAR